MTAKEKLRERVEALSEQEAAEALALLDQRADQLGDRLDRAPVEDEEISPEEEAAVQEARDELAAGAALISHEEIKRARDRVSDDPWRLAYASAARRDLRLRVGAWRVRFRRDAAVRQLVILRLLPRGRA